METVLCKAGRLLQQVASAIPLLTPLLTQAPKVLVHFSVLLDLT